MGRHRNRSNLPRAIGLAPLVMVMFSTAAHADPQLPPRKAGLWENTVTMSNMTINGQKMSQAAGAPFGPISVSCVDPVNDAKLLKRATNGQGGCAPPEFGGGGSEFTMSDSCTMQDGSKMTMSGTMTYLSDEHLVMDMQMSSAPMSGNMHVDSKWSGQCPAGIVPGDIGIMLNGTFQKTANVNNLP